VVGAVLVRRAVRHDAWRTVVIAVAAIAAGWTALFGTWIHPEIARTRSLRSFFARVDTLVPPGAPLHATFPADPGLRFYAPRPVEPWRPAHARAGAYALLWDDERQHLDATSIAVDVLARSEARQARRGQLALVAVTRGLRTGSRSP
jgi:hypothetical protein